MRVQAFDHVHVYAADPERTIAFYERPFGAERIVRYAYVQAPDGVVIELTAYKVKGALRAALPILAGYNRFVHATRRALLKAGLSNG